MASTIPSEQRSATGAKPVVLRHDGPCGERGRCWRAACRAEYGELATIEYVNGEALARCHGGRYRVTVEIAAELWRNAA